MQVVDSAEFWPAYLGAVYRPEGAHIWSRQLSVTVTAGTEGQAEQCWNGIFVNYDLIKAYID